MWRIFRRLRFIFNIRKSLPFLYEFFLSRAVPLRDKAIPLLLFGAYLAFPFDIIPDFLALFGFIDEIAILAWILQRIVNIAPHELKDKYKLEKL